MRILSYGDSLSCGSIITTGNFDGVHRGHVALLSSLSLEAEERGLARVLVTFRTHPRSFFYPDETHQSLTTFDEKASRIGPLVDYIVACDFDAQFARQSTEEFLHTLASRFSMRHYLTGYDHHIGRNREGGYEQLESLSRKEDFSISKIEPLKIEGLTVSSTAIKTALEQGLVSRAESLLGYPYMLSGRVVTGRRLGRTIGFPTANIEPPEGKVFPNRGVYATLCVIRGLTYMSMTNIGHNPTIGSKNPLTIETHIFDFEDDIYGDTAAVYFIDRIRDEIRFDSVEFLEEALQGDSRAARLILQERMQQSGDLFWYHAK